MKKFAKSLTRVAFTITAVASLVAGANPAGASVPTTDLQPGAIERGDDIAIAHMEGRTIVDGDLRIPVQAPRVELIGTSADTYIVVTAPGRNTRVRVHDSRTGRLDKSRKFAGIRSVLGFGDGSMVLGGFHPSGTVRWNVSANTTRTISQRIGYRADLTTGLLATFTRDPYLGGCSVATRLSSPSVVLWRSCKERVEAFSPNGKRLAAIPLLSDGIGPSAASVRNLRGRQLAHYTTEYFGAFRWEDNRNLLLEATGKQNSATVRCDLQDCERASDLRPAPEL